MKFQKLHNTAPITKIYNSNIKISFAQQCRAISCKYVLKDTRKKDKKKKPFFVT